MMQYDWLIVSVGFLTVASSARGGCRISADTLVFLQLIIGGLLSWSEQLSHIFIFLAELLFPLSDSLHLLVIKVTEIVVLFPYNIFTN